MINKTARRLLSSHHHKGLTLVEGAILLVVLALFAVAFVVVAHTYVQVENQHLLTKLNTMPADVAGWQVTPQKEEVNKSTQTIAHYYVSSLENAYKSVVVIYYPELSEFKPIYDLSSAFSPTTATDAPIPGTDFLIESFKGNPAVYYEVKDPAVRRLNIFVGRIVVLVQSQTLSKEELIAFANQIDYGALKSLNNSCIMPAVFR